MRNVEFGSRSSYIVLITPSSHEDPETGGFITLERRLGSSMGAHLSD